MAATKKIVRKQVPGHILNAPASAFVPTPSGSPSENDFAGGKLERRSISEQVAERIMSMIKSGNLKSGDQLPTEQQMTIAFGISRPPLREALKALTLMGVVESRQGGRYTITDLTTGRLAAQFNVMMSVSDYDAHEHFVARVAVDTELVRLCAKKASARQRTRIGKLAADGRAFYDDPVAFRLLDIEFHRSLNEAAGNRLLSAVAQSFYDIALDTRRVASTLPGVIEKSVAQHCAVAEAVGAGDADGAARFYRQHLEHIRDTTLQSMGGTGAGGVANV